MDCLLRDERMDFVVVPHEGHLGLHHYRISAAVLLVSYFLPITEWGRTWSGKNFVCFVEGLHLFF